MTNGASKLTNLYKGYIQSGLETLLCAQKEGDTSMNEEN